MAVAGKYSESFSVTQVFGEPITSGDLIVVPAARIAGGGGGSGDDVGFGGVASPAGALIVQNGRVRWQPVIEPTHVVAAVGVGLAALLLLRAAKRRRARRNEDG